jgi:hypothetical protein
MPEAFSLDAQRARLTDLKAQRDAIQKKSAPLRAKRDAYVNTAMQKERAMNDEIRTVEDGLFDLVQEIAFLTRALGSNVTPPAAAES